MKCLWVGARAATILLDDSAFYRIEEPYTLLLLPATECARFAVLPAFLPAARGGKLPLGTWEGESQPMYAALLNGIGIQDTAVYGRGLLDGQARRGGWWIDPKWMNGARHGRMVFFSRCKNITVQGLTT